MIRIPTLTALVFAVLGALAIPALALGSRQAAIASADPHGTAAGVEVLKAGGNAVDAAVATAFALAVTLPEAGNIGGGGFMTSWVAGEAAFLDFREKAPLAASRDMYLDAQGNFVQQRSLVGALGIGVPGTVKGLQEAHRRYGSLPWSRLLQPAITLARDGFMVPPQLQKAVESELAKFQGHTNFDHYFGQVRAGQRWKQPELAATLMRLAADPDDFYHGRVATQLVSQVRSYGGLMTARDLREYTAVWRSPLAFSWRGHRVLSAPPPSSGGVAIAQLLGIREYVGAYFAGLPHNSTRYIHLLAEIEKRVFADRGDYLGDPDFGHVPMAELTNADYLKKRAQEIRLEGISPAELVKPGLESRHTTHFSIVDDSGNAVALTYTLNWEFGSGVVVGGAGFLLNNEMDDFSAKPGVPNAYGVIGKDLNAIEPGKRMLSSMTPTIVLRDDKPVFVSGAMGGSTIFTTLFQILLNVFDYGMDATSALAATRFHHQLPGATLIRHDGDRSVVPTVKAGLQEMGYEVRPHPWGSIGEAQLIVADETGILDAASDPRGRGDARVLTPSKVVE